MLTSDNWKIPIVSGKVIIGCLSPLNRKIEDEKECKFH